MLRILFVTPYIPSRIRVRSYNLIKLLSPMHEISLVALNVDNYERAMIEDIEKYCVSVDIVPLPKWQAYANCLQALPTLMPLRVAYYRSPAFVQHIKEVIHRQNIEVVHGELIKVVPALYSVLAEEDISLLFDSVDCISWFLQQELETTHNLLKKIFVYTELQKMRRYEREALANFKQMIITTFSERDQMKRLTGQSHHIEVVNNGVDTTYFTPWIGQRKADSLVFCAKLDYFPNTQAILYFVENILPLVWQQRPQVTLTIVGNNPPLSVRALCTDKRITVTGYVPDIRPYLGTASVAIAPLIIAAGIQNKVLEAMAMGLPTVASSRCWHNIHAQEGVHLLVAQEPQAYVDAIVKLLSDNHLAQELGRAGRQFVVENYSWTSSAKALNMLYHSFAVASRKQELPVALDSRDGNRIGRITI